VRAERTLRLGGRAEIADLGSFLERAVRLDAAVLVRLRADPAGRTVSACLRLPFGVLVGRTVRAVLTGGADQTVRAADLANQLATGGPEGLILPERHDTRWRGPLPPMGGWRRLDSVPVRDLRRLVAAGVEAFQAATERIGGPPIARDAADALLDHEALTVSDRRDTAVLPLRVCHAAWRMGFFGAADDADCAVSIAGRWARIAAPFGSAYRDPAEVTLRVR
jgi:hypothetical protein